MIRQLREVLLLLLVVGAIGATISLLVQALDVVVDAMVFYGNPELSIRYAQAQSRAADSTLRLCSTFGDLYHDNPSWGPFPKDFRDLCIDNLPKIEQLVKEP